MLPLKFIEVYFLITHNWLGAIGVIVLVKVLGLGITAFIFEVTREKLMQMDWFRKLYDRVMSLRGWANKQIDPVRHRLRQYMWLMKPQRASRFVRRLMRLRRSAYRSRTALDENSMVGHRARQ
jgi:hypothetical protein